MAKKRSDGLAFKPWQTYAERVWFPPGKVGLQELQWTSRQLEALLPKLSGQQAAAMLIDSRRAAEEIKWHKHGCPYYKVWPALGNALRHVKLEFSEEYLHAPYPVFSIMLPKEMGAGSNMLVSIQEGEVSESELIQTGLTKFGSDLNQSEARIAAFNAMRRELWQEKNAKYGPVSKSVFLAWNYDDFVDDDGRADGGSFYSFFYIHRGQSVADGLLLLEEKDAAEIEAMAATISPSALEAERALPVRIRDEMMTLAMSVCMFGTNQHELVAPDINVEEIRLKYPAGRSKPSQKMAEEAIKREIAKNVGWKLGSEIDLPRPHVTREGSPEKTGRELEYGHMRSAHMRMQPCGPANQDRKLIFVWPTTVRPDLPIRQTHGYRIGAKA